MVGKETGAMYLLQMSLLSIFFITMKAYMGCFSQFIQENIDKVLPNNFIF